MGSKGVRIRFNFELYIQNNSGLNRIENYFSFMLNSEELKMSYYLHSVTLVLVVQDRALAITYVLQATNCQMEGRGEQTLGTTNSLCCKRNSRTVPWVIAWRMGLPLIEVENT